MNVTDLLIPSYYNDLPVKTIGRLALSNCSSLKSIVIPNGVTSIGMSAFYGCSSITSIEIPSPVTNIWKDAFSKCSSLTNIVVDEDNTVYDSRDNCNAIILKATNKLIQGCKTTIIPNSVTSIDNDAFKGCNGLTSIKIPSSVTNICGSTFYECKILTNIVIPDTVTKIDDSAFKDCNGLTVFYTGSVTNWNNMNNSSSDIRDYMVAYYSEAKPTDTNYKYWHYIKGTPTLWS